MTLSFVARALSIVASFYVVASLEVRLMDLPYGYDALSPTIDEATVRIHHLKHHKGYVTKAQFALEALSDEQPDLFSSVDTIDDALSRESEIDSEIIRTSLIQTLGGVANHNDYWKSMDPSGDSKRFGAFATEFSRAFGSTDTFGAAFLTRGLDVFGSGWVFLVRIRNRPDYAYTNLEIVHSANQDRPVADDGGRVDVLIAMDVWEHAYYLKYKQDRAAYVAEFLKIANWKRASELYAALEDEYGASGGASEL